MEVEVELTCAICHRNNSDTVPLIFVRLSAGNSHNGRIVRRQFGDRLGMVDGAIVCNLCDAYVCPRLQQNIEGKWALAWPAVIWTCLSVEEYVCPTSFMHFFSLSMRRSWHVSMPSWCYSILECSQEQPIFKDISTDVQEFNDDIDSGEMGRIRKRINDTAYPIVRCPQGCFKFIDDLRRNRLRLISGAHYLSSITQRFRSFNADPRQFKAVRHDWVRRVVDLDWVASPCMVINEKGINIVACSDDTHTDSSSQWLYVPTNPVFGSQSPLVPDIQAPVVISGNCIRLGKNNSMNTSYPVYEQCGSTVGLSTFRLASRRQTFVMSDEIALGMGLVYTHRPDIAFMSKQSHMLPDNYEDIMLLYSTHSRGQRAIDVQHHQNSGTYVHLEDAHIIAQAYNTRLSEVPEVFEGGEGSILRDPKDFVAVVHDVNDFGHSGFKLKDELYSDLVANSLGRESYSVLAILLHSGHVYEAMLNAKWRVNAPTPNLHALLVSSLKTLVLSHGCRHLALKPQNCAQLRRELLPLAIGETVHCRIASVLVSVCSGFSYLHGVSVEDVTMSIVGLRRNNIVAISVDRRPEDGLPLVIANDWTAMIAISAGESFRMSWRWTHKLQWQYGGTDQHDTFFGHHDLMIYVKNFRSDHIQKSLVALCYGQSTLRCLLHDDLLIRETRGAVGNCAVPCCMCKVHWRCPVDYGERQCDVGICRKHFKFIINDDPCTPLAIGNYGPRQVEPLHRHGHVPMVENIDHDPGQPDRMFVDAEREELEPLLLRDLDMLDEPAVDDIDEFFQPHCPITTSIINQPVYSCNTDTISSGHFYLNHHLRVMSRTNIMKKPPVRTLQFLQNLCSKEPHGRVSLLYPEAMLFPRIFWCSVNESVIGALPSVLYSNVLNSIVLKNVASVKDHFIVRLLDESLMTSHDHAYIQFVFDVLLNRDLNRNSAVIACNRGLESMVRDGSRYYAEDENGVLKFDEIDAKKEVSRLLAMMKTEGPWDYFVTLTCNESKTFGVEPLHAAITKAAAIQGKELTVLLQNYSILLTRAWERTVHYTWMYITKSPEQPLGRVKTSWMRFEFQSAGALGNRPHVHGGVTLYPEPLSETLNRVRCSNAGMWSVQTRTDYARLLADGVIENCRQYWDLMDLCNNLQQHDCLRANSRCMKRRAADDSLVCRVPRHPPSFQYSFEERQRLYDEETLMKLEYLDLATRCTACTDRCHWFLDEALRGGMWHYPAFGDEHFSPTVPRLFALMQSSTNVQVCDRKFQVSYLAKYAAGREENRQVSIQPTKSQAHDEVQVDVHDMINVKISGQVQHHLNDRSNALAREIALTEMIWYCLQFPYVVPSCEFVHASTKPPEYRAVVRKRGAGNGPAIPRDGGGGVPETVASRFGLDPWRHFSEGQVTMISAYESGKHYVDRTTSFSVRPPELHLIADLELYLRWFVLSSSRGAEIHRELENSFWIDGAGRCVKIRCAHISDVAQYVNDLTRSPRLQIRAVATQLYAAIIGPVYVQYRNGLFDSELFVRFVDISCTKKNVVVFPSPTPSYMPNFLVHVLLTQGRYLCEADLYNSRTMTEAYRKANLIAGESMTEEEAKTIVRNYVTGQLAWLPIGAVSFSRRLHEVLNGFKRTFFNAIDDEDNMPELHISEEAMEQSGLQKLAEMQLAFRHNAVEALAHENIHNFPNVDEFKTGPVEFVPTILRADGQSEDSFIEEQTALQTCVLAVENVIGGGVVHPYAVALLGPPGCGKTYIMTVIFAYCLSKNVCCTLTAITSERARKLGGQHLHMLFGIPVQQSHVYTVQSWSAATLLFLRRRPFRYAFLKSLEVILFEEFSLLSAELLALMDNVLRSIKGNDRFMGGVLLIATGDPCQLSPVKGSPVWNSHHILASFRIVNMSHYVRARNDPDLQEVIDILRTSQPTIAQVRRFTHIIRLRCIPQHCVPSWNDVPRDVLRIVGTKTACAEIVNEYIRHVKTETNIPFRTFLSYDEAEYGTGGWSKAAQWITKSLSKQCLEERSLFLHVNQVLRLTYNNKIATRNLPQFSQGQCCVVLQLPADEGQDLVLKLIPPGERHFNVNDLPNEPGWDVFHIRPAPSHTCMIAEGKTKARRLQYRVTYFVCSTVHRALGDTLPRIATSMSTRDSKYRLWERQQLLVVLSRVTSLDNIVLVTSDTEDTILAMEKLLHEEIICHETLARILDVNRDEPRLLMYRSPQMSALPTTAAGFVYMLISVPFPRFAYVGETACISRRILQHQNGHGSAFTNHPHLMPWSCCVLISRFPGVGSDEENTRCRKRFEADWHGLNGVDNYPHSRTILLNGRIVFERHRRGIPELIWEEFGRLED